METQSRWGLGGPLWLAAWPFLFLWPYTFRLVSVGNDYEKLYYGHKTYLLAELAQGHVPLWAQSEAAGYPFFSDPFAQMFYPLNILYLAYYLITGHFSAWTYTLVTIGAFSWFGVGLWGWLRLLGQPNHVAIIATMIATVSFKVTELIRFPNAAHSAAWIIWLVVGITLSSRRQHVWSGALVVGISTLMLLTAGYPYFIIYSLFLIGPYWLFLFVASARGALRETMKVDTATPFLFTATICLGAAIGTIISLPWLLHVQALMAQTVDRSTPDFSYATFHKWDWLTTVGSWIFPPVATTEGWYYFGLTAFFLIFTLIFSPFRSHRVHGNGVAIALLVLWISVVVYFTWGAESLLFRFVWNHTPVLDQMRAWGRMNIILVPALALLLSFSIQRLFALAQAPPSERRRFISLVFIAAFLTAIAQIMLIMKGKYNYYWIEHTKLGSNPYLPSSGIPWGLLRNFDERFFVVMTVLALVGLVVSAIQIGRAERQKGIIAATAIILLMSTIDLFFVSNFQWAISFNNTDSFVQRAYILRSGGQDAFTPSLTRPRSLQAHLPNAGDPTDSIGIIPNWGFDRHSKIYSKLFTSAGETIEAPRGGQEKQGAPKEQIAAARRLYGTDAAAQRLFLSDGLNFSSPADFLADVDKLRDSFASEVFVQNYSGEQLRVSIRSPRSVWLSFIDNWDPNWTATVNGQAVQIEKLLGSYKAVQVPAGTSSVEFVYRPGFLPRRDGPG